MAIHAWHRAVRRAERIPRAILAPGDGTDADSDKRQRSQTGRNRVADWNAAAQPGSVTLGEKLVQKR
jgi:hypothetical protein